LNLDGLGLGTFFEERGKPSNLEEMSESKEGHPDATLLLVKDQLTARKIELFDLIPEFTSIQMDLLERVSGVGRCEFCGTGGTLGSSPTPAYSAKHRLILRCVDSACGKVNSLPAVGEAWLNDMEEPFEDLEEEMQALVEAVCTMCDIEKALQRKSDEIMEMEAILASLAEKLTPLSQENIKIIKKSPQRNRGSSSGKENKGPTSPSNMQRNKSTGKGPQAAATVEATDSSSVRSPVKRNPFKALPKTLDKPSRSRSRSRDRDRRATLDSSDSEKEEQAKRAKSKRENNAEEGMTKAPTAEAVESAVRSTVSSPRKPTASNEEGGKVQALRKSLAQSKGARDGGGRTADGQAGGHPEEDHDRGRRRERSPSPDKATRMDRSTSSTRGARATKKLRQEQEATWIPTRAEYEKLRKENEELKEGLLRLQLSINHLTNLLDEQQRRERKSEAGKATAGVGKAAEGGRKKEKSAAERGQLGGERTAPKQRFESRREVGYWIHTLRDAGNANMTRGYHQRISQGISVGVSLSTQERESEKLERELLNLEQDAIAAMEERQRSGVEDKAAAAGSTVDKVAKKKSKRATNKEGATMMTTREQGGNAGDPMSYAQAAAKVVKDPALEERQARNRRERAKALLLFTAPEQTKVTTPKEWKVLYLKWNLTLKMRKENPKELHHLALRMLEQVKVRKLVREVSLIGKSTIALYYITDFNDRIIEALTSAKVTILDHPDELPPAAGVRNAAVNRVAYLLRRHYYITKLRVLLLSQLDTEELRQEAITKSRSSHHD